MDTSKVFIFGSFSEDEAASFQKASAEDSLKSFKQNDLQFGSFAGQVECSQGSHEISSNHQCNGEATERGRLKLKGESEASHGQQQFVSNGSRTDKASKKKRGSSKIRERGGLSRSPDATAKGSRISTKLESNGEGPVNKAGANKTIERTESVQELEDELNSNFMRGDNLPQLDSLSLEKNDVVEEAVKDPISLTGNIPMSWAERFGGKAGNGLVACSQEGDKGRPNHVIGSVTTKTTQGKAHMTSNDLCGTEIAMKRWQPRGLINAGNLCFLNATLQALLSCAPFFQLLQALRSRDIPEVGYPTLRAFVEFVAEVEEDKPTDAILTKNVKAVAGFEAGKAFHPIMFDPVLKSFNRDESLCSSGRTRQEDAQEFLSFLMDQMHGELLQLDGRNLNGSGCNNSLLVTVSEDDEWETVGPKNQTAVTRTQSFMESSLSGIFGGQLRSVVKSRGNKASATIQPFMLIQLDIFPEAVKSVEDALRLYVSPESLEGYKISTGKERVVSASKSVKLQTLPKVLILHLMRFSYGSEGSSKLLKPVQFSPEIVLGRELLASPTTEGRRYELVATITHHGRDHSRGHYTADAKYSNGQWIRFNDANVTAVGLNKVLHDQAYVLFYKQM
uniref:Ubiquitin carboxyl-terminal hydrolase n=1 Tax=Wollemia nobilis TaxID=56998 RepID=A0A0C9RYR1_9CONI